MATDQEMYQWGQYPQQMYNQQYGIPATGQNPFQSWRASYFQPSYAGWLGRNMASGTYGGETGFRDWVASGRGAPAAATEAAANTYDQWVGRPSTGEGSQWEMINALGRDVLDQLYYAKLQQRYAAPVAAYFAGNRPTYEAQWSAFQAPQANHMSFLANLLGRAGY